MEKTVVVYLALVIIGMLLGSLIRAIAPKVKVIAVRIKDGEPDMSAFQDKSLDAFLAFEKELDDLLSLYRVNPKIAYIGYACILAEKVIGEGKAEEILKALCEAAGMED